MDARLVPGLIAAASVALVSLGGDLVWAQPSEPPPAPGPGTDAGPPPPLPPSVISPAEQRPEAANSTAAPGPVSLGPVVQPPAAADEAEAPERPGNVATAPPPPPPPPNKPVRSAFAVVQVLDKVSAETLKFIAPVGRPVRYKTLVFTVKACETRSLDAPQPQASIYLQINSLAGVSRTDDPAGKVVYRGWMFANAPDAHPFEHPVYDAWLVACSASAPPT